MEYEREYLRDEWRPLPGRSVALPSAYGGTSRNSRNCRQSRESDSKLIVPGLVASKNSRRVLTASRTARRQGYVYALLSLTCSAKQLPAVVR